MCATQNEGMERKDQKERNVAGKAEFTWIIILKWKSLFLHLTESFSNNFSVSHCLSDAALVHL